MGKLKIWEADEDQILIQASTTAKSKKWKRASEELKKHGFQRSDVECRERYINHLDPGVNKECWSDSELEILYNKYAEYGNKWFLLQKYLPGRTQTKIKNYFYGRIRFFLKLITKIILRVNTGFIGDIKTDALLDIYQANNKFQGYSIIQTTIKRLKYKIEKKTCVRFIKENREAFESFAKFFVENYANKENTARPESSEQLNQSSNEQSECGNQASILPVRVQLISSIEPKLRGLSRDEQREYLRKMAQLHLRYYQNYQQAYLELTAMDHCASS